MHISLFMRQKKLNTTARDKVVNEFLYTCMFDFSCCCFWYFIWNSVLFSYS